MNDLLVAGILWIIISSILIFIIHPSTVRSFIFETIGIILTSVGFVINEIQVYRFEKENGI